MDEIFFIGVVAGGIRLAMPIMFAALGETGSLGDGDARRAENLGPVLRPETAVAGPRGTGDGLVGKGLPLVGGGVGVGLGSRRLSWLRP